MGGEVASLFRAISWRFRAVSWRIDPVSGLCGVISWHLSGVKIAKWRKRFISWLLGAVSWSPQIPVNSAVFCPFRSVQSPGAFSDPKFLKIRERKNLLSDY